MNSKYEQLFSGLSDEEIHHLDRNVSDSDKLESAINDWFLNSLKYSESEIINNIIEETKYDNVFSIMTLALWYREGNHLQKSEENYVECLNKIQNIKTQRIDGNSLLDDLQNAKKEESKGALYKSIIGESAIQLGYHYSNSTKKTDLEKAKKYFDKVKKYAPLTATSIIPILGPAFTLLKIGSLAGIGMGVAAIPAVGILGAAAAPIAAPVLAVGGIIAAGNKILKKHRKKKNPILPEKTGKASKLTKKEEKTYTPEQLAIKAFGLHLWGKLSEYSHKNIVSAYKNYIQFKDDKDYNFSAVISLLTCSLEFELKIRFLDKYIDYLSKKFKTANDYISYNKLNNTQIDARKPSILYFNNSKHAYEFSDYVKHPSFTLGSFSFVLGIDKEGSFHSERTTFCDQSAIDYAKKELYAQLFYDKTDQEVDIILQEISSNVNTLREYRNKASHQGNLLSVVDADRVLKILIYTKKILLRIMNPLIPFSE